MISDGWNRLTGVRKMEENNEVKRLDEYITQRDWRVKANANQGYSIGGAILNCAGGAQAQYWFDKVYGDEIANLHKNGDFYIHDLDMLSGYCCGHSLRNLLQEGFNGVEGKIASNPPKHLSSAMNQMVNFLGCLQNEWAGAQAFSSVDTLLAPFVKIERDDMLREASEYGLDINKQEIKDIVEKRLIKRVEQLFQELIFNLSVSCRWGNQTVFSNFSFDLKPPKDLKDKNPLIGGEFVNYTYGDLQKEMDIINIAFCKIMMEGDKDGRVFSFPIPTYSMTPDFDYNSPVADAIFSMASKYGTPYFANYTNTDMSPEDARSMCCRLRLSIKDLRKRGGGLFGAYEQTGSIGVVTINCARLGALYKDNLYERLDYLLDKAKDSLVLKRKTITEFMEKGLYPYTKRYLGTYRNFFNTIGVNGVNEMIENMTNKAENITTPAGIDIAEKLLDHIREKLLSFQEETGDLFNLEATPAEGATYKLAMADKKLYGSEYVYYTNSSQLPTGFTDDPFTAFALQEKLQTKYTGGTVLHLYLSKALGNSPEMSRNLSRELIKRAMTLTKLPYVSFTPVFSVCPEHGYIYGPEEKCPKCGKKTEIWSRVMGYYRPRSSYNIGKLHEHVNKKLFYADLIKKELEMQTGIKPMSELEEIKEAC